MIYKLKIVALAESFQDVACLNLSISSQLDFMIS
jgi:hypothetical protein